MAVNPLSNTQPIPGLGQPVRDFSLRQPWLARWGNLLLACILLSGAAIFLVESSYQAYVDYYHFGPAIVWKTIRIPLVIEILSLGFGIYFARKAQVNWKRRITLFQNGLVYSDRFGKQGWRWDEIQCFRYRIARTHPFLFLIRTAHRYILYKPDGKSVYLNDDLDKVDELANTIRQQIFPRLYSQISGDFLEGKPILFGPLSISYSKGITFGNHSCPWIAVESYNLNRGSLVVVTNSDDRKKEIQIPADKIPNLDVLLSIFAAMKIPGTKLDNRSSVAGE